MDLAERHVVITGAAGGLGPAVVEAMLAAGAVCHLPVRDDGDRLPRHARILAVEGVDLTNESAVTSFYARCPPLWASIHVAGGFKAALITDTSLADLHGQININLATAFLCSREAIRNMRVEGVGRADRLRQLARGDGGDRFLGRVHGVEGGGERNGALARRRGRRRSHPRERGAARHDRHAREPRGDARRRSPQVDQARRYRGGHRVAGVARPDGDVGRARPCRLDVARAGGTPRLVLHERDLSRQTVLVPAFMNVNARPALLSVVVNMCVYVCRLLPIELLPS